MAKTKISTVAKELNVALPTVFSYLSEKGISIEESPNTRVEDNIVEMLASKFMPGKDIKIKSGPAKQAPAAPAKEEAAGDSKAEATKGSQVLTPGDTHRTPRILGKLDLDSDGRPVIKKPEAPKPAAPKPEAPKPAPEAPKPAVEAPKHEPKPAKPAQPKTEEPRPAAPKPVVEAAKPAAPKPATAPVKPEPKPEQPKHEQPKHEEPKAAEAPAAAATDEVFSPNVDRPALSLNIVGKIDLSAINQTTRPKKKGKDDRRGAKPGEAAPGDRKKRKRIAGKDKVDIEKAGRQAGDAPRGGGDPNRQGGNRPGGQGNQRPKDQRSRDHAPKQPSRRPITPEVSEEDVSKQVKETLARLTAKDKGLKKGVKWRKEKREAVAERMREASAHEAEENKTLQLTEFVTANDLAVMMNVPINQVIATCMNLGVMVSINQRLDAETINIVADEFGYRTEYVSAEVADAIHQEIGRAHV